MEDGLDLPKWPAAGPAAEAPTMEWIISVAEPWCFPFWLATQITTFVKGDNDLQLRLQTLVVVSQQHSKEKVFADSTVLRIESNVMSQ